MYVKGTAIAREKAYTNWRDMWSCPAYWLLLGCNPVTWKKPRESN